MAEVDIKYANMLRYILNYGKERSDRTGVGTISIFGYQERYDINSFPLLTTKKIHFKSVVHELLWFLSGSTNVGYLRNNGVKIWDEWADESGELGPVYGKQWRSWSTPSGDTVDQIRRVVDRIKTNPDCRRLIVSAWNAGEIDAMALAPCHCLFQFYVDDNKLSCQLYQRSADAFLGVPFNIASYSLLTMMIAQVTGLRCGEFVHTFGDLHIYTNHIKQVSEQLRRDPRDAPRVILNSNINSIDGFGYDDIILQDYDPHPTIKAKVAV